MIVSSQKDPHPPPFLYRLGFHGDGSLLKGHQSRLGMRGRRVRRVFRLSQEKEEENRRLIHLSDPDMDDASAKWGQRE